MVFFCNLYILDILEIQINHENSKIASRKAELEKYRQTLLEVTDINLI